MSKDLNKVMLTGHLGADPERRSTAQGTAVTTFRVACNRRWRSDDGTDHEDVEWFRVVAWEQLAETCMQYLTKGAHVYIEGRLQSRRWQDDQGRERTIVEVVAQDLIILSSRTARPPADTADAPPPVTPSAPPATPAPPTRRRGSMLIEELPI